MAKVYGRESQYLMKRLIIGLVVFGVLIVVGFFTFQEFRLLNYLRGWPLIIALFLILATFALFKNEWIVNERWTSGHFNGMVGEKRVFDILQSLPDEYSVFWCVQLVEKWDIDFVVVSPTGVFTIEVKSHLGKIGFDGQQLTRYGRRFSEKDVLWQAMNQSTQLHDYLLTNTKQNLFITPVIVFSSTHVGMRFGFNKQRGVYVVQKQWLPELITKRGVGQTIDAPLIVATLLKLLPTPISL